MTASRRVAIEGVSPEIDGGRFPVKRIVGDELCVEADLLCDGHDSLAGVLRYRHEADRRWIDVPLEPLVNDRWSGRFRVEKLGGYRYTLVAWVQGYQKLENVTTYSQELRVTVDREKARFSSWYELFPRSYALEPGRPATDPSAGRHGTFQDLEAHLPYVASMGFDVLYLTPIHPIAHTQRKGKNNALAAQPGEPGSPWAIGAKEGGHKHIHPELGTLEDFKRFLRRAGEFGLEVALDMALQCSPEHPYVREHLEWFRKQPDGTIPYAENPPKKYEDIYPFDFTCPQWRSLWGEMKSIFLFWIRQGVRIFRVDNPHTKPFDFWEWLISEIRKEHPETLFLSEAFTRPKVMYRLAKLGFTQSYTYFCWRNNRWELADYFAELTRPPVKEFFRPCLWPNTPDILTAPLQEGGPAAFRARLVLAATLGASYGIYGAAFELCENQPREPGSEEYLNSEKYEIKRWELQRPDSQRELIARVNRIRRENPALQTDEGLAFHPVDNDSMLCYSKTSPDGGNRIVVVVNLDPHHRQVGTVDLPLEHFGMRVDGAYPVEDLLNGSTYSWRGSKNYVEIDPAQTPAHIFRLNPYTTRATRPVHPEPFDSAVRPEPIRRTNGFAQDRLVEG